MRDVFLNIRTRTTALSVILVVLSPLLGSATRAVAQQPKTTAPDATPPGGRPVAPNRPSGVRGGFDAPGPNEAARPAVEAVKPGPDPGGPSTHRVSRTGISTYPLGTGDVVRITVFQQPDLGTETRVT